MRIIYFGVVLVLCVGFYYFTLQNECLSRDYGLGGTVCVCNSQHCDKIPKPQKPKRGQYLTYTSNRAGLRFNEKTEQFVKANSTSNKIYINSQLKYQKILGWGGAFTDATGINIASLESDLQDKLLQSYFSDDGIEYSLCRVPIGGTDFSTRGYSYDDGDVDIDLTNFDLAEEDNKFKVFF